MKKIFMCMLSLAVIVFNVSGLSKVQELPKLSIFQKKAELLSDKTKEKMRSIHREESALSDQEKKKRMVSIIHNEESALENAEEKEKRMLASIRDNVKQIVQKRAGKGDLYVYNENSGKGVWFDKESIKMSSILKNAAEEVAVDRNAEMPIRAHIQVIQTFSQILSKCTEASKEKYPNIIREQIEKLNFADLLSVFKLAHFLDTNKDVFKVLIFVTQEKMTTLFKKGISLTENDSIVLQNITSNDEGKELFPDTMFNSLLEKIKKDIRQHFLRNALSNEKIFYKTDAVLSQGYDVSYISLNENGSRVWYTCPDKELPELLFLYGFNIGSPLSQIFITPRTTLKRPCWVDEKTIAYIAFESSPKNRYYTLVLHDCITNKDIKKFMDVVEEKKIKEFQPLELLCSDGKIIFLYLFETKDKYGVGIYDLQEGFIKHTTLSIGQLIKLLPIKENVFSFVSYDALEHKIALYQGAIENNFIDNTPLVSEIDIILSEDIISSKEIFSRGIINHDGSKMAFLIGGEICLLSFNNLKIDRFKCEGMDKISALAFSPDGELLMVAGNKEIIAFDIIEREIIRELFVQGAEAFDKNDSIAFSKNGAFFVVGGHSEMRDEFLMITALKSDQDLKKLYLNVVNEIAGDIKSFPFVERVFLYLLSLRSKNKAKLKPLTDVEKEIFQSFDESIQEMLTDIRYVAPGQMSEEPAPLPKKSKLPEQPLWKNENKDAKSTLDEENKSYLRSFLEKAWKASNSYWDSLMKYFPSSG